MTCCNCKTGEKPCPRCGSKMLEDSGSGQRWCSMCDYVDPRTVLLFTEVKKMGEK